MIYASPVACRIKTAFFNTSRDRGIELAPAPW